jgi:hypothetical protein
MAAIFQNLNIEEIYSFRAKSLIGNTVTPEYSDLRVFSFHHNSKWNIILKYVMSILKL